LTNEQKALEMKKPAKRKFSGLFYDFFFNSESL
jgi:hypothetical protein